MKRILWTIAQTLALAGGAQAQSASDSAKLFSSTDNLFRTLPQGRTNAPFFDLLHPNAQGLRPVVLFASDDRLFAGLIYNAVSKKWRTDSTGRKHKAWGHYSISQRAFSIGYQGVFNRLIGGWNLFADAGYDWVKWTNFYGLGNETVQETTDANFYRIRSRDATVALGFQHKLGRQGSFTVTPYYQRVHLIRDEGRHFVQYLGKTPGMYEAKNFAGLRTAFLWQRLNDLLVPTKGFTLSTGINFGRNLGEPRSFGQYNAGVKVFVPFFKHFMLSVENAAATVTGSPEFYQLASIGGNTLRGYRRERFWGETSFHNNNELHYIFNAPWKAIRGKMGFLLFADQGRVWKRGERSDAWHHGYGGGVFLAPRGKVYLSAQLGVSNERKGFHFVFRRVL